MKRTIVYNHDGSIHKVEGHMSLAELQRAVGGYIQYVFNTHIAGGDSQIYVNEEGRLTGLPVNQHWPEYVGNVVVLEE